MYKTQKMPAHWCIYKLMLYIHFIKYLFYISEYKAMLIQLLICYIYILGMAQYHNFGFGTIPECSTSVSILNRYHR